MNSAFRHLHALLTAAILVIGTLQMAYASGQAHAVDEMVLCTGHGAVTIGIDADGNPTGEVFYCPECASTAFVAVQNGTVDLPGYIAVVSEQSPTPAPVSVAITIAVTHPARGPPVSV